MMKIRKNLKGTGLIFTGDLCPEMHELLNELKKSTPKSKITGLGMVSSLPKTITIRLVAFNMAETGKKFLMTNSNVTWPYFPSCQSVVLLLLIMWWINTWLWHYNDVIMNRMASQMTSLTIVYSTVYSGTDQRKHQSSALLAFVRGIHRWPVNSPHKWLVTREMFPFDDVIMSFCSVTSTHLHSRKTFELSMGTLR